MYVTVIRNAVCLKYTIKQYILTTNVLWSGSGAYMTIFASGPFIGEIKRIYFFVCSFVGNEGGTIKKKCVEYDVSIDN